jgi:hypothetical protein
MVFDGGDDEIVIQPHWIRYAWDGDAGAAVLLYKALCGKGVRNG